MICYARPASMLAVILMVGWLVFSRPVGHFLDTAALMVAVAVATGVAAVAAVLVFAAFLSTRRRRAAAGGCVGCQFRCQHAMTEPSGRLWLVSTADRRRPGLDRRQPGLDRRQPGPVFLPMPPVGSAGVATPAVAGGTNGTVGPRWPDRPAHRARERAGSPA